MKEPDIITKIQDAMGSFERSPITSKILVSNATMKELKSYLSALSPLTEEISAINLLGIPVEERSWQREPFIIVDPLIPYPPLA
jgi:hypothetical protein